MKKIKNDFKINTSNFSDVYSLMEFCINHWAKLNAITDEYNNIKLTYKELSDEILYFAAGLKSLGIKKGDFIGLFSESHGRWPSADLGILANGAIDVVRGSNAPIEELCYISLHSECKAAILRDEKLLQKMLPHLKNLNFKFVILLFGEKEKYEPNTKTPIYTFKEVINIGLNNKSFKHKKGALEDVFTILYTSGTTGNPKGVMLTNKNFVSELKYAHGAMNCQPGNSSLQILPIWHAYERIALYYLLTRGCHLYYTTLSGFKNDMKKYKIDFMMSVPRIWESIREGIYKQIKQKSPLLYAIFDFAIKNSIAYKAHKMYGERRITNKLGYHLLSTIRHRIIRTFLKPLHVLCLHTLYKKIKDNIGMNFKITLSGGGALSTRDELFYDAIGVNVRIGYGLTETAPVVTLRHANDKNFLGSVGKPYGEMEIKIVDPQTHKKLGVFQQGLVMTRGPQIMKGYLKDKEATKQVIDRNGWFNTGDLGWLTKDNNLVLVGRLKETIVLSSGENVEPVPIEQACLMSPYIEQIVLVGQDESGIGALVVPSKEALLKCGINMKDTIQYKDSQIDDSTLRELIKKEINANIINKVNLKPFEKIKNFIMLSSGFNTENGLLSATAKIKRNKVFEKYKKSIDKMYNK